MLFNASIISALQIDEPAVAGDPYGPNLIENGTFTGDDTTGWALNRCSVSSEALQLVNATGFLGNATYTVPAGLEEGATYLVEWDVTAFTAAGGATRNIVLGGTNSALTSADMVTLGVGHFSREIVAGSSETFRINTPNGDNYTADNISVRKVL